MQESKASEGAVTQAIRRAVSLIKAVANQNDRGTRLSQVANDLGLHPATAYRILNDLVLEGLLVRNQRTKRYHVGFELYRLAQTASQFTIREYLHETMDLIASHTADAVMLIVRVGPDSICIARTHGSSPLRVSTIEVGERRPLGLGAGSAVILASLSEVERERLIEFNSSRYKKHLNLTVEQVRWAVQKVLETGYMHSDGLFMAEVGVVGVPVLDKNEHVIAALSVGSSRARMTATRAHDIANLVRQLLPEVPSLT